jgi:DNA polymerase III psi subunit
MDIEQDYLANIFDGDQLFVFQSEEDAIKYNIDTESSSEEVSEPKSNINPPVVEKQLPQKEVVILVNQDLAQQEKETLNKLLKAINIEEGQYEIIKEHPEQLKSVQHLKLFLSFHNQFVQSQKYSILKINKGNAIYAHDLAELNRDTSKKLMLWNLLKAIV